MAEEQKDPTDGVKKRLEADSDKPSLREAEKRTASKITSGEGEELKREYFSEL